ncbi:MAG TPA: DUF542 domain-containing protein [Gemmatimonadaceae bacterium]|nr:DUF542 domain-containing protein [Gemmatimonadaceae bacterium]
MPCRGTLDPNWTVHRILTEHPATAPVFARFGIHTCCGGGATVSDAAARDGVDVQALCDALNAAVDGAPSEVATPH